MLVMLVVRGRCCWVSLNFPDADTKHWILCPPYQLLLSGRDPSQVCFASILKVSLAPGGEELRFLEEIRPYKKSGAVKPLLCLLYCNTFYNGLHDVEKGSGCRASGCPKSFNPFVQVARDVWETLSTLSVNVRPVPNARVLIMDSSNSAGKGRRTIPLSPDWSIKA